jgi:hypothetical protein
VKQPADLELGENCALFFLLEGASDRSAHDQRYRTSIAHRGKGWEGCSDADWKKEVEEHTQISQISGFILGETRGEAREGGVSFSFSFCSI